MTIDRETFLQEQALRTYLRKRIVELHDKQVSNENILRESIRSILLEDSGEVAPHESTGINVLEDVLKKIIPVLEDAYKRLTTSFEQRNSFSNHIVQAVKNSLAPIVAIDKMSADDQPGMDEDQSYSYSFEGLQHLLEDITVDVGGEEEESDEISGGFIDIDGNGLASDTFGLEGEDETGRNFAEDAFNRIETVITDAYSMLSGDDDKKLFYEYLLTNLKLYFDKFEDELKNVLPDYEDAEVEAPTGDDEETLDPDEDDFFS